MADPEGINEKKLEELMKALGIPGGEKPPPEGSAPPPPTSGPPPVTPTPAGAGGGKQSPSEQKAQFEEFPPSSPAPAQASIEMLRGISLQVKVELGRAKRRVQDVLKLGPGSVIELDRLTGDPLDLYVNGVLVARGEVLVVNENFAIRVTEVVLPEAKAG